VKIVGFNCEADFEGIRIDVVGVPFRYDERDDV
jgi:hypothetical protein